MNIKKLLVDIFVTLASLILLVPVCVLACFHAAKDLPIRLSELMDEYFNTE